ncbi:hypothetical protein F5Y04DRAFT_73660 [Hypomontagnella monticulosa]|nr:hypothetical protein F5Y04DRAFT_73660 [Hypomontagnella monticulosa]
MSYSFASNYEGVKYFIPSVVLQALALLAVICRLWSRRIQRVPLQVNDYAILIALMLTFANLGVLGASVAAGLGIHIYTLSLEDAFEFSKLQTAISAIWLCALLSIKISIIDLYVKIFRIPWFTKTCYTYLVIATLWTIAAFLEVFLLCQPLAYQWDKSIQGGKCGSFFASYYSTHIIIFLLDFALASMPIPVLWTLKMELRKKVAIALMFGLGLVIIVFNLIRIAWREKVASSDITYEYALLFCFTVLEPELGILLACIPTIQPVLRKLANTIPLKSFGSFFSQQRSTRGTSQTGPLQAGLSNTIGSNQGRKLDTFSSFDIETDSTRPFHRLQDYEMGVVDMRADGIEVTQSWEVRRS